MNNERCKRKLKKYSIYKTSRRIKYLVIDLTKEVKSLTLTSSQGLTQRQARGPSPLELAVPEQEVGDFHRGQMEPSGLKAAAQDPVNQACPKAEPQGLPAAILLLPPTCELGRPPSIPTGPRGHHRVTSLEQVG